MGTPGFPFPSLYDGKVHEDDPDPPVAIDGTRCFPPVFSPGTNSLRSPLAGTPSCDREKEILPSVVSPIASVDLVPHVLGASTTPSQFGHSTGRSSNQTMPLAEDGNVGYLPTALLAGRNNLSLPTPPQEKRPVLRLPSFRDLGIAMFHPTAPSEGSDSLPVDMARVTPPTVASDHVWQSQLSDLSIAGGGASANRESGQAGPSQEGAAQTQSMASIATESDEVEVFLKDALRTILNALDGHDPRPSSIRVLSHSLPSPTVPGHLFPQIIESVKHHNSSSPLVWINHLHAVPHRFNVSDLPSSPPSTPGQPLGTNDGTGEDYFTVKTFESAVIAMDYSSFSEGLSVQTAGSPPRSTFQQELAAPSSLNLIIVERYIPPLSTKEFINLFSLTKPSLLSDRLFELVPGNGCVVFIYPTRTGAQKFCDKLFGPIMDPLLRGLAVVNGFSADLSRAIGTMSAVPHMYEFEGLKYHIKELCEDIHDRSRSDASLQHRLRGDSGKYSLLYAEKKSIQISREIWTDWWVKQEKERVRRAISRYFRFGNRVASDSESHLTQEVFEGIRKRDYPIGSESLIDSEIEVGVFVISRER